MRNIPFIIPGIGDVLKLRCLSSSYTHRTCPVMCPATFSIGLGLYHTILPKKKNLRNPGPSVA